MVRDYSFNGGCRSNGRSDGCNELGAAWTTGDLGSSALSVFDCDTSVCSDEACESSTLPAAGESPKSASYDRDKTREYDASSALKWTTGAVQHLHHCTINPQLNTEQHKMYNSVEQWRTHNYMSNRSLCREWALSACSRIPLSAPSHSCLIFWAKQVRLTSQQCQDTKGQRSWNACMCVCVFFQECTFWSWVLCSLPYNNSSSILTTSRKELNPPPPTS